MIAERLVFRNGVEILDPIGDALLFLEKDYSYRAFDTLPVAVDNTVTAEDIRSANHLGGRVSAAQQAELYARRLAFEEALGGIPPELTICDADETIPWDTVAALFRAGEGVKGVGLSKLTKFLHKKRPALVPILDSVICEYLASVSDLSSATDLGSRGVALMKSYKADIDANRATLGSIRESLGDRGFHLTECRILDLYTWAYAGETRPAWAAERADANEASPLSVSLVDGGLGYYEQAVTLSAGELFDRVIEIEQRFRAFVRVTFRAVKGDDWESAVPSTVATKLAAKRGGSSGDLLEWTDLGELRDLVLGRWAWFVDVLGDKHEFITRINDFRACRNALAHGHLLTKDRKVEFAVTIRLVGGKIPIEAHEPPIVGSPGIGTDRSVLWADDRPELTLVERQILRMLGVSVVPVRTNDEAIATAGERTFDLVISDIDRGGDESGGVLPERLREAGLSIPTYFYVGRVDTSRELAEGVIGITSDPSALIRDVLTHLGGTASR